MTKHQVINISSVIFLENLKCFFFLYVLIHDAAILYIYIPVCFNTACSGLIYIYIPVCFNTACSGLIYIYTYLYVLIQPAVV